MASVAQVMPGIFAGCYKNGGTYGSPTWADQTSVKNLKIGFPWDFVDAMSRQYPVKVYAKTFLDIPVQAVLRTDPADAILAAWVAAAFSRTTTFDLLIINSKLATQGAYGIRGEFLLSLADEPQEESGSIYTTFDLKPTLTGNGIPQWVTMGASSTPAFTAFSF